MSGKDYFFCAVANRLWKHIPKAKGNALNSSSMGYILLYKIPMKKVFKIKKKSYTVSLSNQSRRGGRQNTKLK